MTYAGVDRDVIIVGRAGQAEIWDAAEYEAFETENLSPEKLLASLEAIGL
jgi:DNA-binding transcriptional regulator/RsmH inhibitor MraZ